MKGMVQLCEELFKNLEFFSAQNFVKHFCAIAQSRESAQAVRHCGMGWMSHVMREGYGADYLEW